MQFFQIIKYTFFPRGMYDRTYLEYSAMPVLTGPSLVNNVNVNIINLKCKFSNSFFICILSCSNGMVLNLFANHTQIKKYAEYLH